MSPVPYILFVILTSGTLMTSPWPSGGIDCKGEARWMKQQPTVARAWCEPAFPGVPRPRAKVKD